MSLLFILFLKADFSESSGTLSTFYMFTKKTIEFLTTTTQGYSSSDQAIWLYNASDNPTAFLLYSTLKFYPLILSINYDTELLYSWSFHWWLKQKKHWLSLSVDTLLHWMSNQSFPSSLIWMTYSIISCYSGHPVIGTCFCWSDFMAAYLCCAF